MVFLPPRMSGLCGIKNVGVCVHILMLMALFVCVCVCGSLQCLGLSSSPPLPLQAHVEASELLQEARVRTDVSVRPNGNYRLLQRQALHDHQEGQHQCCRATHTHQAVDKHSSWDRDI